MSEFRKDLLDFIGRRIVVAMREIKPKLLAGVSGLGEEECAEQEGVYLIGLLDGLNLAGVLAGCSKDEEQRPKESSLSPEV